MRRLMVAGLAGMLLLGAACSSGADRGTAVRQGDSGAGTTVAADESATTTTVAAAAPPSTTTTTTAAGAQVIPTTARRAATASQAQEVTTTTTGAPATTVAPTTTTTAPGAPTTTAAPATTTTTRPLEAVPALMIVRQTCSAHFAVALPETVDMPRLKVDLEAQGYAMPSPTLFRDWEGQAVANQGQNLDDAQKRIDRCASDVGGPASATVKLGSGSAGSSLLGQLVKDQIDGARFKNYKGTTVAPAA